MSAVAEQHDEASDPKPQSAEIRIAERLRRLRMDKNLTLAELARIAGMSQAYLSRVENHKASLTIVGLEQVSAALGVPIGVFFEEDNRSLPIVVCRRGQGPRRHFRGPAGFEFEMLAAAKAGKLMEPLIVDLATARTPMPLKSHTGDEFNYVLDGQCVLIYGDNEIVLRAGDSVYYDAAVPHAARCVQRRPCRLLVVVGSRDYLFHGDLSRLLNGGSGGR
jgi:transcriptional regulator with XRE-family HTH domain